MSLFDYLSKTPAWLMIVQFTAWAIILMIAYNLIENIITRWFKL